VTELNRLSASRAALIRHLVSAKLALTLLMLSACRSPTRVTTIKPTVEGATQSAEPYKAAVVEEAGAEKWVQKAFTEAELGIKLYPKAKPIERDSFETLIPSQLKGYMRHYIHAAYETTDSYSQVLTWYLAELKGLNVKVEEFKASNGMNAILRIDGETDKWLISLQQLEGKHGTLIVIKRVSY